jgi:hypothetical protein
MSVDAAAEWNRLADMYRQKSDDELQNIAAEAYDLTDTARDVLSAEIRDRKLPLTLSLGPAPEERSDIYDPSAEEEFKLAVVFEAKNPEELLAVTHILDDVDTPYVIGDENLERPEDFHGSFEKGVAVKVAFCEMVRVNKILEESLPAEMWGGEKTPDIEQLDPTCPACHSKEIIFVCKDPLEKDKFRWRCKDCNLLWIDDGIVK